MSELMLSLHIWCPGQKRLPTCKQTDNTDNVAGVVR